MNHFENLWERAENSNKNDDSDISAIVDEITIKLNFYKAIGLKKEIPIEEAKKAKEIILGDVLYCLTNISVKDNIDVFNALLNSLKLKQ